MDRAFDRLYLASFGNALLPWEDFTAAALEYFDANSADPAAHDAYFNNFTVIWTSLLNAGRLDEAEFIWEQALQPAQHWEQTHQGQHLHKGTAYYFWAMTSLLRGHIDHGYLLIHQGVAEDIRTSGHPTPDTPGFALVSLNDSKVDQAFRQWVVEQASFLSNLVANYCTTHHRGLTIDDVKRRFIANTGDVETIFLLTYTIARLRTIVGLPDHATNNRFAGQLQINLLFDVTLVIDAAIRAKNPTQWKFIDHAEYLLRTAGHQLTTDQLRDINRQFEVDFDATLQGALNATLVVQGNALDRVQCDVALAYGLRNHGAHNVGAATTIWSRFREVHQAVFRVLCATVDYLY